MIGWEEILKGVIITDMTLLVFGIVWLIVVTTYKLFKKKDD